MATMNTPTIDRRTMGERRSNAPRVRGRSTMSALDYLAMALLIIGGLNWAMVGLFDVDMVATILGPGSPATRIVYVVVGLAALYSIYILGKMAGSRRAV
ncbi:DUF378 domain-containing protein [Massilia sp. MS-15]|uniref:DUF378 domain-containing protein n=1 Tax=Massilia sp. MS-15 TaxID=2878200 RepID=UPI001CD7FB58|nr:DUF378 domain-containing protein [Massilia sp. MS-15]MCA1248762.1 DUF378 domain-containing protein [Massilia sp. MS-15]